MPDQNDAPRWIAALRRSHDELVAFVAGLTADAIRGPSGCAGWTVAQVLSHLGSGAEIGLRSLRANLSGEDPPPNEENHPIWDRWNAMTADEQAAAFPEADERFVAAWEGVDGDPDIKLPFLPEPISFAAAVGFRLSEHAVHAWDVRVGFDDGAALPADVADLLVQRLPMMVGFLGKADRWTGGPQAVAVNGSWTIRLGDSVSLEEGAADDAGTTLTLPTEALIRLVYGRLPARWTPASVTIDGAVTLDDLRQVFPGF